MKKKLKDRSKIESKVYSICNDVLMYNERVVVPLFLQKRIDKKFYTVISRIKTTLSTGALVGHGWRPLRR